MSGKRAWYLCPIQKQHKYDSMETKMIGKKIAEARKKLHLSQADLADQLFISSQAVGKWERGESVPDILTMNRLAIILGVDLNYFSTDFSSLVEDKAKMQVLPEPTGAFTSPERALLTNFNGSNLSGADFAAVTAHKSKFNGSALRGASFAAADLSGSLFKGSDLREINFDGTNLTNCTFTANDLTGASFNKTILAGASFSSSAMNGAKFNDVEFTNVKLVKTELSKTIFENCVFKGVDLKYVDLHGLNLDGQTFIDVSFDRVALNETTFNGATFRNVSFRPAFALTNKYYRAIQTIRFDGAQMDKLTYAALKGIGADLSKVTAV